MVIDGTVLGKAVKHLGIRFPNAQIVKDLGYSKGVVSEYLNNKKLPSEQFIEAFENFYKIDLKSFIDSDVQKEPDAIWVNYERFKLVPLVTHRAQAGFLSGWGDDEYMEELPKVPWEVDKEYKGRYVTFEVAGDSMESDTNPRESIFEGDLLLCREVQRVHWKNKLPSINGIL